MRWGRVFGIGLSGLLLTAALLPWLPDGPDVLRPVEVADAALEPLPPVERVTPRSAYPETLARPLFRSTRRPEPAAPVAEAAPPAPPRLVGYRLTGIVSTGARHMILLETPGGKSVQLYEGESVDGWTVETITTETVVLSQGETRVDLLNGAAEDKSGGTGRNTRWLPAGGQTQ
ncbi:hypothetical protein NUH88_14555 [Nisaea acidiphila]|uniref:Type II secretion system protein GspC N-terminal domain-containing protein n=1 Tax=Nisaea acidiphila TaxID=1862145 RepID=A0A9J7ALV6_9PROT|nr:hypothetical protein [Nisaea acidiphila]UUX48627.1 hypothetical protein NUH88_14555 [Nisaea acidiphila]